MVAEATRRGWRVLLGLFKGTERVFPIPLEQFRWARRLEQEGVIHELRLLREGTHGLRRIYKGDNR